MNCQMFINKMMIDPYDSHRMVIELQCMSERHAHTITLREKRLEDLATLKVGDLVTVNAVYALPS